MMSNHIGCGLSVGVNRCLSAHLHGHIISRPLNFCKECIKRVLPWKKLLFTNICNMFRLCRLEMNLLYTYICMYSQYHTLFIHVITSNMFQLSIPFCIVSVLKVSWKGDAFLGTFIHASIHNRYKEFTFTWAWIELFYMEAHLYQGWYIHL